MYNKHPVEVNNKIKYSELIKEREKNIWVINHYV
jgi:hypothetical protein